MRLKDHQRLYVASMGKLLRVTATFPDSPEGEAEANAYMARKDNDDAVVAVFGGVIMTANLYDKGVKILP